MNEDLGLKLQAENLTYYRNIQYLKEMTKQATSLLLRSNAVYEDILGDVEMTLKVRGLSDSTDNNQSKTQETACEICKMFHGAPFCIIDQINKEEKSWADRFKRKLSSPVPVIHWQEPRIESISDLSVGIESWRKPHKRPKVSDSKFKSEPPIKVEPWSFKIDGKATPEEILTSYEIMCTRYGNACGERYFLASSLAAESIQTPPQSPVLEDLDLHRRKKEFRDKEIECHPHESPVPNYLCPEYSEEVRKKFEKVVDPSFICDARDIVIKKRWRDVFCKPIKVDAPSKIRQEVEYVGEEDEERVNRRKFVVCRCAALDCDCGGIQRCPITTAKKRCGLLYNEDNNYLCTVRNRMERRKLVKMNQRRSSMTLSGTSRLQTGGRTRRHSSIFTHLAYEETLALLNDCIWEQFEPHSDSDGLEKYQRKIEALARLASPSSMIAVRDWNAWYETYEQQNLEEKDEDVESLDSEIQSSISDISDHSRRSSDLDYKENKRPSLRIPYAAESNKQLDYLFKKINLKLEKTIMKNCMKSQLYDYRPIVAYYFKKLRTMRGHSQEFTKILDVLNQSYVHMKNAIPSKILKRSKIRRKDEYNKKCMKLCNRRAFVRGVQTGKRYKDRKNLKKYTKEGNYLGFSPEKRKLLRTDESKRLRTCDLVGDVAGREITKRSIHNDYRLLCDLFDESSSDQRMNLLSEDMKRRKDRKIMREYGEQGLPEPPECSLYCSLASGISQSGFRKYPEKGSITKKDDFGGARPKYSSVFSNSSQTKSEERSSLDQRAKVSTAKSGRKVSQSLLLGSLNDGPSDSISPEFQYKYEIDSMTASMKSAAAIDSMTASMKSAAAIDSMTASMKSAAPKISPPESLTHSFKWQNSGSLRTSKNTISEQLPPFSPRSSRKESSKTLVDLSKLTQDSTQIKQKLNEPRESTLVRPSQESFMSRMTRQNLQGSLTDEPGSRMIHRGSKVDQESIYTERGSKIFEESLIAHIGSKRHQGNFAADAESKLLQDGFISGYGTKMLRESLIGQAGSRMIDPSKLQAKSKVAEEEPKVRPVSRLGHESDFLSDMSITKLRSMKPADRLGPTKKRVFGVDIGQGIHYVQYLKDNAAGADEEKKQEMITLLTQPREKKRVASGKPVSSKQALNTDSFVGSSRQERQESEKFRKSESISRKLKMSMEFDDGDSQARLHRHPIKTLDQIYKEVHGINARNTPISLIENDYEHELMKKQQLRKHKINP